MIHLTYGTSSGERSFCGLTAKEVSDRGDSSKHYATMPQSDKEISVDKEICEECKSKALIL